MNRPDIKSPDELTPELSRALHDLILSLADSKRIMGIRYSDWVLGAPELEASIAASSLAQDEWGHSRILYALLKDFGENPQAIEHERDREQYCNIEALDSPLETWPEFVVTNAIVDGALTEQLEALGDSRYATLRQRVQKQLEEERFHQGHAAAWLARLGTTSDATRGAVQAALDARWGAVLHWFGPDEFGAGGTADGLWERAGGELRQRFMQRLVALIERCGLNVPEVKLDFSDWDATSRRKSRGGPDEDAVARARGDRSRAMLLD
jgi:phenylacetate-CoA oxygenase PaaI subunit